jgi:hypothetical protein
MLIRITSQSVKNDYYAHDIFMSTFKFFLCIHGGGSLCTREHCTGCRFSSQSAVVLSEIVAISWSSLTQWDFWFWWWWVWILQPSGIYCSVVLLQLTNVTEVHTVLSSPRWWRQYTSLKRRSTSRLRGAISNKAEIFYLPTLQEMLKMFPIGSDTFPTPK